VVPVVVVTVVVAFEVLPVVAVVLAILVPVVVLGVVVMEVALTVSLALVVLPCWSWSFVVLDECGSVCVGWVTTHQQPPLPLRWHETSGFRDGERL